MHQAKWKPLRSAPSSKGRVARFDSRYRALRRCAPDRAPSYKESIFSMLSPVQSSAWGTLS